MIRALPAPARLALPQIPTGPSEPLVARVLPAAAFALLCLWSRSRPVSLARQLSPDVLPF